MALSKDIKLENGIEVPSAYLRIDTIGGDKRTISIQVNAYINREAYIDGKAIIGTYTHSFIPLVTADSANFIAQGYSYLKTLEKFKSAVDC